ncbi:MAG: glycosyltransferase family 39 protein [Phycisphaerae bacterium]
MTSSELPAERARRRRRLNRALLLLALATWFVAMLPLAFWGLPTSADNDLLFGGGPPWPAERYRSAAALESLRSRRGGADADLNPLSARDGLIDLTESEAARAEILRRYRLYSRQPDEMITFRALQRMSLRPLDLDPRLYQYGGAYVYGVGAALALGHIAGALDLSSDAAVYLSEPERFARFYVVARTVSLLFGTAALAGAYALAARAAGRRAGWLAVLLTAASPVFITQALEAKPHLPSACLLVWAAVFALRSLERRRKRDALLLGCAGGGALALVLTGAVAALYWPAAWLARHRARGTTRSGRLGAAAVAALIYCMTNPYVLINAVADRETLLGNIGNSTAMYSVRQIPAGAVRTFELLFEGAGPLVAGAGLLGFAWLLWRWPDRTLVASSAGLGMVVIGVLLGAGKPAEYARFLVLPVILLAVAAAALLANAFRRSAWLARAALALIVLTQPAPAYLGAFAADAGRTTESRQLAAWWLRERTGTQEAIGVIQEPAPYSVPPLDFTRCTVVLLPQREPADLEAAALPAWLVFTADDERTHASAWWRRHYRLVHRIPPAGATLARIAWANKPVFIYERVDRQ